MTTSSPSPRSSVDVTQALRFAANLCWDGRLNEAEGLYRLIILAQPRNAEAQARLGDVNRRLGRLDAALENYQTALALEPDCADLHNNLAGLLQSLGRGDEALACGQRAVAIAPGHAEAHFNLGVILQARKNDFDAAIVHYRRALEIRPDFVEAHNNLANALQKLGRFEEALAPYAEAIALRPGYVDARHNFGKALQALDQLDAAIEQYEAALAIDAARAALHKDYATALIALGRAQEAEKAFLRAAALAPEDVAIHLDLASHRKFTAGDPRLAALETFAANEAALDENDRIALHFALGKAYADLQRPVDSLRRLLEGNRLKRQQVAYDEAAMLRLFERIRAAFSPELFLREKRGGGAPSDRPVFVLGMPRSGTTLIEQILASHSQIFGAGELDAFERSLAAGGDAKSFPEFAPQLSHEQLGQIGARYLELSARFAGARVVDKMPANFAYVGLIHLALPNAKIIHARRDPVDTCLSCFSLLFTENQPHTYDLGELGRYYRGYAALMDHWRRVLPPGVMIEVDYEDVVADLEGQARRLIAHCGLQWEAACLDFHATKRPVHTASVTQVRQPLYAASVGRWRLYGSLLQPLLEALDIAPPGANADPIKDCAS